MTITVLLFGPQAQSVGASRVQVEVAADSATAGGVLERLPSVAPSLAASIGASRLAINHEFAEPATPVAPGDEVALIGMVSGG